MNKYQDQLIAGSVVAACLAVGLILLAAIGKFNVGAKHREITIDFGRVDNVKAAVTEIKLAGLPIGKVTGVRILPPEERANLGDSNKNIRVTGRIDTRIVLSTNTTASIRQASLMSEHFIELSAGMPGDGTLAEGAIINGLSPAGVGDLLGSGGAGALMANLRDTTESLKGTMANLNLKIPGVVNKLDSVLANADKLMGDLSSEETRERLTGAIANLKTMSDNLKIVTTHAKLVTATLAQRPWRVLFGGEPNKLPSEDQILRSNKPVPVKPAEGVR